MLRTASECKRLAVFEDMMFRRHDVSRLTSLQIAFDSYGTSRALCMRSKNLRLL